MNITGLSVGQLKEEEQEGARRLLSAQELAREVKRLRRKAKLNQEELAEKVGLSQTVVSDIELGNYQFPIDTVVRIARAFNVSPYRLLAIYLREDPDQFDSVERNLLDKFIALLDEYRINTAASPQQLRPNTPMSSTDTDTVKEAIKENRKLKVKENPGPKDEGPGKRQINK